MFQVMYEESEHIQEPCLCPPSPPPAAAAAAAAIPAGPQNVVIREIDDPAIIAAVDENTNTDNSWAGLLMTNEKKEKVTDSSDSSKSLKIKDKKECAPRDITYYVYVFKAQKEILAKLKEKGASKVMIFYKGDYVFVYSRHGDRFPEPDQMVVFRSDRTNRNLVEGKEVVKRFLYVRSFRTVADNCWFLGRVTCHARAVAKGATHMVNNANKSIEVYGIVLNADKTNQKKSRTNDDPKEFHYDTLWIEYDENNAADARRNEIVTKTFSNIQVEYPVDEMVEVEEEVEVEAEKEKEKEPAWDMTKAFYSQDTPKVKSPTCSNNLNLNQNLEGDKKTPVITASEPDTNEVEEDGSLMKDTYSKASDYHSSEDSEECSESESESESENSESEDGPESGSGSGSECSECSEESSESEEGSENENENENNFYSLAPAVDPIYNSCTYWGYQGYCDMESIENSNNSNNSVNMGNSLCPSFEKRVASPSFGFTNGMDTETYEPFQGTNFSTCCGPVSALEVFNPENENSEAHPQDVNVSNLKRRLITLDGGLYANIDGTLYSLNGYNDDQMMMMMEEDEEEMPLLPPNKKARTK